MLSLLPTYPGREGILKGTTSWRVLSWGLLHPQLVKEAIASFEPTTFLATVKGESMAIIAKNRRKQFKQVFHLGSKEKHQVTREWTLTEFCPSLKENADKQETLRIADCQYPGAKRPLRLLSSLFFLNTTHQHHIATSFAELILVAVNGQPMDWPQEFYYKITEELLPLHSKHRATKVKVGKTSIGPHVTLILKAAGALNIREELEVGYRSPKALTVAEQVPHPKLKKSKHVQGVETQPKTRVLSPPNLKVPVETRIDSPPIAQVYTAMPQVAKQTI